MLDLFCGAGGLSCGFMMEGFDIVMGVDNWKPALDTYKHNHPDTEIYHGDIRELTDPPKSDIVVGGPPCPEFSVAKNDRDPEKGMELVNEYLRIVEYVKPKYWIMENVRGIRDYIGYDVFNTINVFNCADFGVPQKRIRCFSGNYPKPIQTHAEVPSMTLTGNKLKPWVTVKDALGNVLSPVMSVKRSKKGDDVTGQPYFHENSPAHTIATSPPRFVHLTGRALKYHILNSPSNTIDTSGYLMTGKRKRDERGNTILTSVNERRMRKLSPKECAKLQSFPDWYVFKGTKTQKYRQIGNAVPPLMARALAKAILVEVEN